MEITRTDAIETLEYLKKQNPQLQSLDVAIADMKRVKKLNNLVTMYKQKGNAPTRMISMENLKRFLE